MTTRVSIIIPVYNDLPHLRICLGALAEQVAASRAEVLVVDNDSDESVAGALAPLPGVRILRESKPGSYAARNRGIREARGDILAFTDADCIPAPDWLKRGMEYLDSHHDVSLVAGRVKVVPADPRRPTAAEVYETLHAFPQEAYAQHHNFAATANLFIRREVLDAAGTFLESVKSGGDWEFGQRATAMGFTLAYASDVVVVHPARPTLRLLSQKTKRTLAGMRDLGQYGVSNATPDTPLRIARGLVPPVPSAFRALTNGHLDRPLTRLKYAFAVIVLHYVRVWARIRLLLGVESPR